MEKKVIIGLETHVQLNTMSKLFCGCKTQAVEPNTATCPVCLGHPGAKPVLNKAAVGMALKIALALNCKINPEFFFSRKTYFYPDMAKNFQITQYEVPLGENGHVVLSSGKKILIQRIHLEEDPAALVHEEGMQSSSFSLVDYNRSGLPLVEIVTTPCIESAAQAREYLNALLGILGYLDVFVLGKNSLKADANISIGGGERVEVKNVTGFKAVEAALSFEEKRQKSLAGEGKKIVRETRGFDEANQSTFSLRSKETEEDYGYIFEPDIPKIVVSQEWLAELNKSLPELPEQKARRFQKQFNLPDFEAKVICSDRELSTIFEESAKKVEPVFAARFLARELLGTLNYNSLSLNELGLKAPEIIRLLELLSSGNVSEKNAKLALIKYATEKIVPSEFLGKNNLLIDVTGGDVEKIVEKILAKNPQALLDVKAGKEKAMNFLVGLAMRETKGKAQPREIQKIIKGKI